MKMLVEETEDTDPLLYTVNSSDDPRVFFLLQARKHMWPQLSVWVVFSKLCKNGHLKLSPEFNHLVRPSSRNAGEVNLRLNQYFLCQVIESTSQTTTQILTLCSDHFQCII